MQLQIKERIFSAEATLAQAAERQRLWEMVIQAAPLYANYQKQTKREIPLVVLNPRA